MIGFLIHDFSLALGIPVNKTPDRKIPTWISPNIRFLLTNHRELSNPSTDKDNGDNFTVFRFIPFIDPGYMALYSNYLRYFNMIRVFTVIHINCFFQGSFTLYWPFSMELQWINGCYRYSQTLRIKRIRYRGLSL